MKKWISILLLPAILLGMVGCSKPEQPQEPEVEGETTLPPVTGFVVPEPMTERPIYTVSENPTNRELRETAVKAMHDMLSIQWCVDTEINYNKTGAVSHKNYHYDPNTTYCGIPYADGQTNLYVWLEYYDYRCGQMHMEGDGTWLNKNLGNTCAGSVMWAWSTVCDSLTGVFINYNMVPMYGCIPVGDYQCERMNSLTSWKEYPTKRVCEENGRDVMYESYAKMQLADAITSTTKEHTMMAIEDAVVVRDPVTGKIDPINSYVMVQDQAAGTGNKFFEYTGENGYLYQYTGRPEPIAQKCTFQWMFDVHYIPVTTAELAGTDPYTKAEVKFSKETYASVEEMLSGAVSSNYPMSLIKINAKNAKGKTTKLSYGYIHREDVPTGVARNYNISQLKSATMAKLSELPAGEYTVEIEVTSANGEIFVPAQISYTK